MTAVSFSVSTLMSGTPKNQIILDLKSKFNIIPYFEYMYFQSRSYLLISDDDVSCIQMMQKGSFTALVKSVKWLEIHNSMHLKCHHSI